ncbi:amidohydrolase family protein [Rhizosphaericola mali]|uniref:Amidohydrolase n=1 Tax=Rhizosphaericola mali TaxID=2545455 RepID=A0A5P2GA69_9BACT|nr:amidohydrolase family protein [Rhizosphaericola mali]QES88441.1 amidohydrolase [Rhizosphaericola mali]
MKVITIEEHVAFEEMQQYIPLEYLKNKQTSSAATMHQAKLEDIVDARLKSMDDSGISMQVLSVENMDIQLIKNPVQAIFYAQKYNDLLAEKIKDYPTRFAAFAHLPLVDPQAAAIELERTVTKYGFKGVMLRGTTNDLFLDTPHFAPLLAMAERLNVPIYIHPGIPPQSVLDAYYSNVGELKGIAETIACWGWGWHTETAIHVLRLLYAGIFDKYPKLNIVVGHMGEMLPFMWERSNRGFTPGFGGENKRTLKETFSEQLYITTSGFFSMPPLQLALDTIGIDHIIFSIDYPFSDNKIGMDFFHSLQLPKDDLEKLAFLNAEKLLGL